MAWRTERELRRLRAHAHSGEATVDQPSEIGSSIVIKGEVIAQEDLVVSGRVEGSISAEGHALTIKAGAHIAADVEARAIEVAGQVSGTLCAGELIALRPSARVEGEISAPSLRMEDGAVLQGKGETTRAARRDGLQLAS
jgi:cytoskeletal protein CcmA (bactofilin family)